MHTKGLRNLKNVLLFFYSKLPYEHFYFLYKFCVNFYGNTFGHYEINNREWVGVKLGTGLEIFFKKMIYYSVLEIGTSSHFFNFILKSSQCHQMSLMKGFQNSLI